MASRFVINQELAWCGNHYLKDAWLVHNGVPNNGTLTLWRNGTISHPASGKLWPFEKMFTMSDAEKKEIVLTSQQSSWYRTKEEAIAACEKYGHKYTIKE
jgi:hypothetical protein